MKARLLAVVALALGSIPGLLLPIVATERLQTTEAAALLLSIGIGLIVTSIGAGSIESVLLAALSSDYARGGVVPTSFLFSLSMRWVALSVAPATALFGGLAVLYVALGAGVTSEQAIMTGLPIAAAATVMVAATPFSAHLYARRRLPSVYVSSLFRGAPPLIAVWLLPSAFVAAVAYLGGEIVRCLFLIWRARTDLSGHAPGRGTMPSIEGRTVALQVLASGLGQVIPTLAQAIFAWSGPVAVAQGSIALRLYSAANQFVTSGATMHHVTRFAPLVLGRARERARATILRELRMVTITAAAIAILSCGLVATMAVVAESLLDPVTVGGLWWSLIPIAALPATAATFWAGRALLLVGMARVLPLVIGVGSLIGAGVGLVFVSALAGAAGLLALATCSVVTAVGYAGVLLLKGPGRVSSGN